MSDEDGEEDGELTVVIPISERCYQGCRQRAVVNDGGMYCASCWLKKHRHR